MRNKNKYLFGLLGCILFAFSACSDIEELNTDPNNPTAIPAANLVSQAQFALNNRLWSRVLNAEWGMIVTQQWAQNEYGEEGRYEVDVTSFDASFRSFYVSTLRELQVAAEIINADEGLAADIKTNQLAIIEVLNVHAFHNLTDAFGDIPYSQALNQLEFPNPAYDAQSTIYPDLVARLAKAAASIDEASGSFGAADLIYGGNMTMWKKLANSLTLRIAMRMSDADETGARNAVSSMTAGMLIADNSENALFVFDATPTVANPLYIDATINTRDDFAVSTVLVENLTAMGDPRLTVFADTTPSGTYNGMPPGLLDNEAFDLKPVTSRPYPAVRAAQAPAVIMDYAEVSFLLTEAYAKEFITGDATAAYAQGVTASMNYWGFADQATIDGYIAANAFDAANWKESLGWQKWIAFYMNGPQAWAEWRRLDHPVLELPAAAVNGVIPVRLPYALSETSSNSSFNNATPNDISTKMWWDIN
jgi:hypothetical protein